MSTQRWAYETLTVKPDFWTASPNQEQLKQALNDMGQKGWELVSTTQPYRSANLQLIFKREI